MYPILFNYFANAGVRPPGIVFFFSSTLCCDFVMIQNRGGRGDDPGHQALLSQFIPNKRQFITVAILSHQKVINIYSIN